MRKFLKQDGYIKLRERATYYYSTQQEIRHVINSTSIQEGDINLEGAAKFVWDALLSYAENNDKLLDLVRYIQQEKSNDEVLSEIRSAMENGTAYINEIDYTTYIRPNTGPRVKVLLIYDLADVAMAKKLKMQLYPLELEGAIKVDDMYHDTAGLNKEKVWLKMIGETEIALLLVTPDFFNPENDCLQLVFSGFEMRKTVIPVLIADSLWGRIRVLKDIFPLPIENIPVSKWQHEDEALMKVAEGVERTAKRIKT